MAAGSIILWECQGSACTVSTTASPYLNTHKLYARCQNNKKTLKITVFESMSVVYFLFIFEFDLLSSVFTTFFFMAALIRICTVQPHGRTRMWSNTVTAPAFWLVCAHSQALGELYPARAVCWAWIQML